MIGLAESNVDKTDSKQRSELFLRVLVVTNLLSNPGRAPRGGGCRALVHSQDRLGNIKRVFEAGSTISLQFLPLVCWLGMWSDNRAMDLTCHTEGPSCSTPDCATVFHFTPPFLSKALIFM